MRDNRAQSNSRSVLGSGIRKNYIYRVPRSKIDNQKLVNEMS